MPDKKEYDINTWEQVISDLPKAYKEWFEEEKVYLRKNITKDSKVLEVGCGEGRSLRDILPVTKNIFGIDHDPKAIEDAKISFSKYPAVKLSVADARKLPFEDESFDYVICMTTFANFGEDKIKVLKEMKRVLNDNGKIILSVYSEDAFDERMNLYKKVNFPIDKIEGTTTYFEDKWGEGVSEQFSETELRGFFKEVKLKVNEIIKLKMSYICKLEK